jgi:hypothetical protein
MAKQCPVEIPSRVDVPFGRAWYDSGRTRVQLLFSERTGSFMADDEQVDGANTKDGSPEAMTEQWRAVCPEHLAENLGMPSNRQSAEDRAFVHNNKFHKGNRVARAIFVSPREEDATP